MVRSLRIFKFCVAALVVAAGVLGFVTARTPAFAKEPAIYTGLIKDVAVGGYDPVAYFASDKAVRGLEDLAIMHDGVTWRFASEENRELFLSDPDKYAPRYGGYCAWAVSQGYTAKGDPEAWSIVDGRLYLNYNKSVRRSWLKNAKANITKGDANWPRVLEK